ncbi:DUF488 domain-containing protein [Microbacterium sp. NPDC055357]
MAQAATPPLFTVGHSDLSSDEFIGVLEGAGVELLVDIRRLPGSRAHPHFDQDPLTKRLETASIGYDWAKALTGRRSASKDVPREVNAFWQNRSFHNYADWALTDEFHDALEQLRAWSLERPTAIMCSEAVWWRCHRRIVADHVLAAGDEVRHIIGAKITPATLTAGAVIDSNGRVTYPG